jgi:predicted O-methyltransferase YrrM
MGNIRSSYAKNNFGGILRALILGHRPKNVVEFGVLDGYSTFHIAHALRFNDLCYFESTFKAYDIWDNYEYKHGKYEEVKKMINRQKLEKFVTLCYGNFYTTWRDYNDESIDFLHVDISNDGGVLENCLYRWGPKISCGGVIAFEGGSVERDNVQWMRRYNKKPIHPVIVDIMTEKEYPYKNWIAQIYSKFPSMTLLFKR